VNRNGAATLLAHFTATSHPETSGNLDRWTQNGVEGYNRAWVQRAAFDGASPSGTHAYRMRYGDSVGNVPGGAPNGLAEFGLVFPADYGADVYLQWKLFIPDGSDGNGPALNFVNGQGGSQVKLIRVWTLKNGESMSSDGAESYAQGTNLGCSEFSSNGLQPIYNLRNWNGGAIVSDSGGPDQWYVTQHPASGVRDSLFKDAANYGRWATLRCHYKLATEEVTDTASPSNGIGQTWLDGVLLNGSGTDFRSYPGPTPTRDWRYAYLMGPRDVTTYPDEVMWIDDVRVYKGGFP
jgi:hypothetical protein